jgi:hypothetical protein
MATFTTRARTHNALALKLEPNLYIGIGQTTPWGDEAHPDVPVVTQSEINELIFIKKVAVKHLVKLEPTTPDVEVNGVGYAYVDDADVYTTPELMLYMSVTIEFDDIAPTATTYRQIGLILDPQDAYLADLTNAQYLGADVSDQGQLLWTENIVAVSRDASQREKIELILNY